MKTTTAPQHRRRWHIVVTQRKGRPPFRHHEYASRTQRMKTHALGWSRWGWMVLHRVSPWNRQELIRGDVCQAGDYVPVDKDRAWQHQKVWIVVARPTGKRENRETLKDVKAFHHSCAANKFNTFLPRSHPLFRSKSCTEQQYNSELQKSNQPAL